MSKRRTIAGLVARKTVIHFCRDLQISQDLDGILGPSTSCPREECVCLQLRRVVNSRLPAMAQIDTMHVSQAAWSAKSMIDIAICASCCEVRVDGLKAVEVGRQRTAPLVRV